MSFTVIEFDINDVPNTIKHGTNEMKSKQKQNQKHSKGKNVPKQLQRKALKSF